MAAVLVVCTFAFHLLHRADDAIVRAGATAACRDQFVAAERTVPESARDDLSAEGGPTTFDVSGSVEVEMNSGEVVSTSVRCLVTLVGGETWRLESLTWA